MISILITFYNQKDFVRKCLDSVLEQDFTGSIEILIGDDGSTDGTLQIIQDYISKYPELITLYTRERIYGVDYEPIERATNNRLELLASSRGDFVCFLDGDDYYCDKSFFSNGVANLNRYSNAVACAFEFLYISSTDVISLRHSGLDDGFLNKLDYIKNSFLHVGCILFRNCIDNNQINVLKNVGVFDDNIITLYFLSHGELFHISKEVYAYRQNNNGIWTSSSNLQKSIITLMAYDVLLKLLPDNNNEWLIRYYSAFKTVFSARNNISKLVGKSFYERFLRKSNQFNYKYLKTLLSWPDASFRAQASLFGMLVKAFILNFYFRAAKIILVKTKFFLSKGVS